LDGTATHKIHIVVGHAQLDCAQFEPVLKKWEKSARPSFEQSLQSPPEAEAQRIAHGGGIDLSSLDGGRTVDGKSLIEFNPCSHV
jgi:hypothetical protein